MSISSIMLNTMFGMGDKKRDKGLTTPESITRCDNIAYADGGKYNLLDVYYPKKTDKKLPTIVNIHGGGWVYGTKETYQFYCMELAGYGFTVVNFSYRLAPKAKFPAQLEDVNSVLHWVYGNQDEYFMDYDNIVLIGDSAGAHLTSLYSAFLTDEKYRANFGFEPPENLSIRAIVLNCGVSSIKSKAEGGNPNRLIKDLMGKEGYKNNLNLVDPSRLVNGNFPPTYLMSATGDFLLKEHEPMKQNLLSHGVECETKVYGSENKKLMHVFHLIIRSEDAKICNDEEVAFIRKHLK